MSDQKRDRSHTVCISLFIKERTIANVCPTQAVQIRKNFRSCVREIIYFIRFLYILSEVQVPIVSSGDIILITRWIEMETDHGVGVSSVILLCLYSSHSSCFHTISYYSDSPTHLSSRACNRFWYNIYRNSSSHSSIHPSIIQSRSFGVLVNILEVSLWYHIRRIYSQDFYRFQRPRPDYFSQKSF